MTVVIKEKMNKNSGKSKRFIILNFGKNLGNVVDGKAPIDILEKTFLEELGKEKLEKILKQKQLLEKLKINDWKTKKS